MIATRTLPKYFNTAGPIQPDIHYTVEPLSRIDLEEVEQLIYQRKYFILHAPRQTGKTSCLLALRDYLNAREEFIAVYANVEAGQAARNDVARVVEATASSIAGRLSLILGNFSKEEIHDLYMQHTAATGQEFHPDCFPLVWTATEGQPWLVNALAYEVTMEMKENRDRSICIIPEMIYRAQERIIYRRDTHIDILIDKLREERVRSVIAPILAGEDGEVEAHLKEDDIQYVIDLGLIVRDKPLRIANAIYKEVIPRELTWARQQTLTQQSAWYIRPDGSIDMQKLLLDFQQFFRQNADSWIEKFDYKESGPQLLLQAFLQRVVNGGGYIDREYGLGRGRTDLLITKPLTDHYGGPMQRIVLELKILRSNPEATIEKGLEQTARYMDRCGGTVNEGHFILFDRHPNRPWDEKLWHYRREYNGREIEVWGM